MLGQIKSLIKTSAPQLYDAVRRVYLNHAGDSQAVFNDYYVNNSWDNDESRSGGGSTLEMTETLRRDLPGALTELGVKHLVDAPCGDYNWMRHLNLPDGIRYTGCDVVADLIANNQQQFGAENVSFQTVDLIKDTPPECDLIICRDCLIHVSNAQAKKALGNMKDSGAKFIGLSQLHWVTKNDDTPLGGYRPLNFLIPPFSLPPPVLEIFDGSLEQEAAFKDGKLSEARHIAIWRAADLPG